MDNEGTHGTRGTRGAQPPDGRPGSSVPHPAGPPPAAPPVFPPAVPPPSAPPVTPPAVPKRPATAPGQQPRPAGARSDTAEWLNAARPRTEPGVWRYAHVPRPAERPPRPSLVGPLATMVLWLLLWLLLTERAVPYVSKPIEIITGPEWWSFGGLKEDAPALVVNSTTLYYQVLVLGLGFWAARIGGWAHVFRYFAGPRLARARLLLSVSGAVVTVWLVWTRRVPLADIILPAVPTSWMQGGGNQYAALLVSLIAYALIGTAIVWPFARIGQWQAALAPSWDAVNPARSGPGPLPHRPGPTSPTGPNCGPPDPRTRRRPSPRPSTPTG